MFCHLGLNERRQLTQLDEIGPITITLVSSHNSLQEYLRGCMESPNSKFALCGSTNECARTITLLLLVSEVPLAFEVSQK